MGAVSSFVMKLNSCLLTLFAFTAVAADELMPFDSHGDVGLTQKTGSVEAKVGGVFRVSGSGANIWAQVDAFQYVWKKVSGNVALTADIEFEGSGVDPHRKAGLMIRQSLEPGSPYADAIVHGDGLTGLQFRLAADGITQQVASPLKGPKRLRIERRGDSFTVLAGNPGETLQPVGPTTVILKDPVYIGLAISAHRAGVMETAIFSNVRLETLPPRLNSKITIYDFKDKSMKVVHRGEGIWEAPNWSRDGQSLVVNSGGKLYRLPVDGGPPQALQLDAALRANNDHDLSPDGKYLAISASSPTSRQSQVYVALADGSNAKLIVSAAPSYFHGWSPDGRYLSFVAQRAGSSYDIFRIPAGGGVEERITSGKGYDDGPDYSRDGKWIYFNSDRSGGWDIWRVPASGGGPGDKLAQRVTSDEGEDWFPHPSPDGKWLLYLTFPKGTEGHNGRLPGMKLRRMKLPGDKLKPSAIETVAEFFGGQGTINVNSWAPDSRRFAFVSYELAP